MRKAALLALATMLACRIVDPHWCPETKPTISCNDAQAAFAGGRVDRGVYGHCGTDIELHDDGGHFMVPDRCDLHARCDGGFCPGVRMGIE